MPRRPEQALRGLGILDGDDAVGDLDERAGQMPGLDLVGGEGIGQIFARAAEIEQEIDADIVDDQRGEPDQWARVLLAAAAATPRQRRAPACRPWSSR